MSIGLQLLRAILDGGSRQALRSLDLSILTDQERPAAEFVLNHMNAHGALPTLQIMTENGFAMMPSQGNVSYYVDRLRSRAVHTAATAGAQELLTALRSRNTDAVRQIVSTMNAQIAVVDQTQSNISLPQALTEVWTEYQIARAHPGMRGITTAFNVLDHVTAGLRPGDVTTIVARPGVGKSWTIMQMAKQAWLSGSSIAFISMEMMAMETARRIAGMATGINPDLIARGQLSWWGEEDLQAWIMGLDGLPPFNMLIGDLSKSIRDVDMMIQEHEPDIVYIDASYLLKPTKGNTFRGKRWESIAETAEEVKSLAIKRSRHIVQTVQFNRTSSEEDEMDLSQIGGTDIIGQVSSLAVGIRPGAAPNERNQRRYQVLKNRHGIDWLRFETNFRFDPFNMDVVSCNLPQAEFSLTGEAGEGDGQAEDEMENI